METSFGQHTVATLSPGSHDGQSDFTITKTVTIVGLSNKLSYTFPDQELCVIHHGGTSAPSFSPCDQKGEGGFFVFLATGGCTTGPNGGCTGLMLHSKTDECLEPNLLLSKNEDDCSPWTVSETPTCSSTSEMVIS